MQLLEAMKKRTSLRDFTDYVPSAEEIDAILEAIYYAPIVFMTKDTHISVITDKKILAELDALGVSKYGKLLNAASVLYGAPVYFVISAKLLDEVPDMLEGIVTPEFCNRSTYWTIGTAVQNIQLRAVELGLATCPANGPVVGLLENKELARKIGIPEGYTPITSIMLGKSNTEYKERANSKDNYHVKFI
ncbi:MAG: nitroreductase family protein [Campylobacter sp.]|nr:nitroreductase family protein [Campylobacter sp.]